MLQIANELLGEVRAQVGMLDRIDTSTTGANDMLKSSMAKFNKACSLVGWHEHYLLCALTHSWLIPGVFKWRKPPFSICSRGLYTSVCPVLLCIQAVRTHIDSLKSHLGSLPAMKTIMPRHSVAETSSLSKTGGPNFSHSRCCKIVILICTTSACCLHVKSLPDPLTPSLWESVGI